MSVNNQEMQYIDLINKIIQSGETRNTRNSITKSTFGEKLEFDISNTIPIITTKKLAWKSMLSELLWFIEGSGDERRLKDILYNGSPDQNSKTIWSDNANAPYWKPKARFQGDLGRIYGVQWRTWRAPVFGVNKMGVRHIDQLQELINSINKDPFSRRHIISAWNPGEIDLMALPPCHMMAQFYVSTSNKLSCQMYQRSADMFLGVPFNISSYAVFTHMIAQVCNLEVGELVICLGDAHIYENHIEQVKEQLSRKTLTPPTLKLNPDIKNITDFTMKDVELVAYKSHDAIQAPMAA
jgi:thymidylate synthase